MYHNYFSCFLCFDKYFHNFCFCSYFVLFYCFFLDHFDKYVLNLDYFYFLYISLKLLQVLNFQVYGNIVIFQFLYLLVFYQILHIYYIFLVLVLHILFLRLLLEYIFLINYQIYIHLFFDFHFHY